MDSFKKKGRRFFGTIAPRELRRACITLAKASYTSIEFWERQPLSKLIDYLELTLESAPKPSDGELS